MPNLNNSFYRKCVLFISLICHVFACDKVALTADELPSSTTRPGLRGFALPRYETTLTSTLAVPVARILVQEGQSVSAGDALIELDQRIAAAEMEVALAATKNQGSLRKAKVNFELAQRQYDHTLAAQKANASSNAELFAASVRRDEAQSLVDIELENHNLALKRLELAKEQLASYTLHAPFNGRVTRIYAQPGDTPSAVKQGLITIAKTDELICELFVPLDIYKTLNIESSYTLYAEEPINRDLIMKLKAISPNIDPATRTVRCVFSFDNSENPIVSGFAVHWKEQSSILKTPLP